MLSRKEESAVPTKVFATPCVLKDLDNPPWKEYTARYKAPEDRGTESQLPSWTFCGFTPIV